MIAKNSSNKSIGEVDIGQSEISIRHYTKPQLVINDPEHVSKIINKDIPFMKVLYDEYYLTIGEIGCLYGLGYTAVNNRLKQLSVVTGGHAGRRNSAFGTTFSEERKEKIGAASKGRIIPQYERTSEIRQKISNGLKQYFQENEVSDETRQKLSDAWARGCYSAASMGRGIQGHMYSVKMNKDFFFRSLLELKYLLSLEIDDTVDCYQVEPFQIKLSNNAHYTPDVLINNHDLIELKPLNHLKYTNEERFNLEVQCAKAYCEKHNFSFKVVYDVDIDFETRAYKTWLRNNPSVIELYNIRFVVDMKDWS